MTVVKSSFEPRQNDLYETEPWAVDALCRALKRMGLWRGGTVWEPAAGNHRLVLPLIDAGASRVITSDICTYDAHHNQLHDFLGREDPHFLPADFDIITNPPYGSQNRLAVKFASRALELSPGLVAMLLTAKFDFGSTRTHLFADCPRFVGKVVLLDRISWEGNNKTGTEDHAWYVWAERGVKIDSPRIVYEKKI